MRVLIAGAGIGGLTAALALHAVGVEAVVLESAREIRPLGVGINLLPHAVGELTRLGLDGELARLGIATRENLYCDSSGARLFSEPRGLAGGYQHPQYSVHRGRLQTMLLSAVRARLGEDAVRTGMRVEGFDQDADSVRVGISGRERPIEADLLVGADGVHSVVRAQLHPGEGPLLWSGVRMWRGVTRMNPFFDGRTMVIVRGSGDGDAELIAYPIGPASVNWVALVPVGEPGPLPGDAHWNRPGRAEDLLPLFDWNLGWLDVAELITRSEVLLEYPMVDRDPLPHWGHGRVTLLGDAAHPMYPVGANGASQAVVDARVLATELSGGSPAGLARYEGIRRDATAEVIAANREMQRTGGTRSPRELARITETYRRRTTAQGA
ncbi:flavin-dependent oxidoreductase [Amycolatopsis cynarae]|uniref:Flavin-dependent oxidoreductase n=1 Tax=Amycolatopsis cynarae TaxID=2995223 RepID=A0ABY7B9Q4_9PSEU|nr:flavin-dependent oxidoreductase [Amycolatopsis sp. HUAS 11-8]WAL69094.1 flavin-dependent oxidoreductase [Amycolatopsis sp. HUAS 11-8]